MLVPCRVLDSIFLPLFGLDDNDSHHNQQRRSTSSHHQRHCNHNYPGFIYLSILSILLKGIALFVFNETFQHNTRLDAFMLDDGSVIRIFNCWLLKECSKLISFLFCASNKICKWVHHKYTALDGH